MRGSCSGLAFARPLCLRIPWRVSASASPAFGGGGGGKVGAGAGRDQKPKLQVEQVWSASEAAAPSLSLASLWRLFEVRALEQAQAKFQAKGGKPQSITTTWPLRNIRI